MASRHNYDEYEEVSLPARIGYNIALGFLYVGAFVEAVAAIGVISMDMKAQREKNYASNSSYISGSVASQQNGVNGSSDYSASGNSRGSAGLDGSNASGGSSSVPGYRSDDSLSSQQSQSGSNDVNNWNFNISIEDNSENTYSGQVNNGQVNRSGQLYYAIGEHAVIDGVSVTLVGVERSQGNDFLNPDDGTEYLFCEFDIENNSGSDIILSSILSFDAYVDDYAMNLDLGATLSAGMRTLDESIPNGKKIRGAIGYQVPVDWNVVELWFTPDFWFGDHVIFTVNRSQAV